MNTLIDLALLTIWIVLVVLAVLVVMVNLLARGNRRGQ